jgi:hypothetical protein
MKELIAALLKAQAAFEPLKKSEDNPFFHSKYANLENCIDVVKKPLLDNGLAVVQTFDCAEGKNMLVTTLYHISGQFITGKQILESKDPTDPQKIASCSTYARRYGLMAILGLAAEDDDGNNAAKKSEEKPKTEPPRSVTESMKKADIISEIFGEILKIEPHRYSSGKVKTSYVTKNAELGEIEICVWTEPNKDIQVGFCVIARDIQIGEFRGSKTYTAKSIEVEVPFGE